MEEYEIYGHVYIAAYSGLLLLRVQFARSDSQQCQFEK